MRDCGTKGKARLFGVFSLTITISALCGSGLVSTLANAAEDSVASFFRGRTITLGVPSTPGAAYDTYAKLVTKYFSKYVPGNPNVVAQYVPSAGGMVLANSLYNTWSKDGTALGIVRGSTLYEELFRDNAAKFHGPSFTWLGNLNSTDDTCLFSAKSQVTTPADFYAKEHIIGASAVGALAYSLPKSYDDFLGTKFNIVLGYEGVPDRVLALERGEIDGMCGVVTATVKSSLLPQLKDGTIRLVVQAGLSKDPDFQSIPNMLDQARNKDARLALEFLFAQLKINIALAAPPGIPPDRAEALRVAFSKMINDPDLRAETKAAAIDFHPLSGKETSDVVNQLFSTPSAVVDRVSAAVNSAQR